MSRELRGADPGVDGRSWAPRERAIASIDGHRHRDKPSIGIRSGGIEIQR